MEKIFVLILCMSSFHLQAQREGTDQAATFKALGEVKWKFKTNGRIFSSPAIKDNVLLIGSEDKHLYGIDAKTGKEKWKFQTGGNVSSPTVKNNLVYVLSFDGYVYALDLQSGKEKWKFKTGGEQFMGDTSYWGMKPKGVFLADLWDCFLSSPVVDGKENNMTLYIGSSDAHIYALNTSTGELKWKYKTRGPVHSRPTLEKGVLYAGSWDTYLYALDAQTGKEKWKFKTGDQIAMTGIQASPTVTDGVVYFGARDAHLYALSAVNGNLLWKYDAQGSWIVSSAVVKQGTVYVGTSDSYLLLALDAATGKEKFRFKTTGYVFGTPAVTGNTAYVGDFTGRMYAIDISSAGRKWNSFTTDSRTLHATQVLKNDTLNFMYAAHGSDLSFYQANKKVMDDFYTLGSIVSSPVVQDDVIYFGSADGYVYALHLK